MSATGFRRLTSSAETSWPTSSEYTRHSRTRRAISCAYWPPRSSTSTVRASGSAWGAGNGITSATSGPSIVGGVLRDRDVVRVALPHAGAGDAHEPGALQLLDRRRAAVPHRLPQATDELVEHGLYRALVRDAPFDPLRHELVDVLHVALEVAILGEPASLHRAERAHAAVLLEPLALDDDDVARRLVRSGQHRAGHDRVGAGGDCLGDVAGGGEAAVRDERHIVP